MVSTIIFLATFINLSLWFLFKENKAVRSWFAKGFLASGTAYFLIALFLPGYASWMNIGLHTLFLFVGGFFLNTFSNNKIAFFSFMALLSGGYFFVQTGVNPWPFDQTTAVSKSTQTSSQDIPANLDENNELLVELSERHQMDELQSIISQYNLEMKRAFSPADKLITELDDYYTVNIPSSRMVDYYTIVTKLKNSGIIDHVEPNEVLSLDPSELNAQSNPPGKGKYSVDDPALDKVWGFEAMQVEQLYQYMAENGVVPTKKAKIAIIDTGVDKEHEDLKDNFVSTREKHNQDPHGHGTHCAGIAAAVSNNATGIASFAPNGQFVEVTSIKVFGKYGNTTQKIIIEGMLEAADNGAAVLSMSLGGPATSKSQRAYKQAVNYVNKKGGIVVVAAGNENMDASKRCPASVDGVITVSAVEEGLKKAKFSNRVDKLKMGIAAPGANIYSTMPGSEYDFMSGTSMATPYVAGLLGLMKAIKPQLNTQQAYKILKKTGMDTKNTSTTGKLINPSEAIKELLK